MEQQPTIEGLQEQLKVVTEDCYQAEMSLHKLERNTEDVQSIFQKIQQLFNEMRETWQEGEMSAPQIADLQQETVYQQQGYLYESEEDYEKLQKKKHALMAKEDELYYQKLNLSREEQTHEH